MFPNNPSRPSEALRGFRAGSPARPGSASIGDPAHDRCVDGTSAHGATADPRSDGPIGVQVALAQRWLEAAVSILRIRHRRPNLVRHAAQYAREYTHADPALAGAQAAHEVRAVHATRDVDPERLNYFGQRPDAWVEGAQLLPADRAGGEP